MNQNKKSRRGRLAVKLFGLVNLILAVVLVFGICLTGCGQPSEKPVLTIGQPPYTHAWVPAHIIKHIAEELGYPTEIAELDIGFMFEALASGDVDVYPDVWLPTLHKTYMEKYKGQIDLVNVLYEKAFVGWVVPSYVEIDSISELEGRGDEFSGRIVGIEPGAGMMITSEECIEAYDLGEEYELVEGSTVAMLAEVEYATQNNEPIVFVIWRPHDCWATFDLKGLEDPKGIWKLDDAITGVPMGFDEKAPDLYHFLQNFSIDISDVEKIQMELAESDRDIDELTKEWIENNRQRVDEMLGR